jgi:hypothetical protein
MSKCRKRRAESFEDQEAAADLNILVFGRDEPIAAHHGFLEYFSTVLRDLHATASSGPTTWDLRQAVLEGDSQPVDASTVQTWLDVVCSPLYARRSAPPPPSSLEARLRLLKFADFAGTRSAMLHDIGKRVAEDPGAFLEVAWDKQQTPRLMLHSWVYYTEIEECLFGMDYEKLHGDTLLPPMAGPQIQRFQSTLSSALENALYLAARLDLPPLVRTLRDFVRRQLFDSRRSCRVLDPGAIYTPRVLQHLPFEVLRGGFLESALMDLSSSVVLTADSVVAALHGSKPSNPAAILLKRLPGERVMNLRLEDGPGGDGVLRTGPNREMRITATIGGLDPEERRALVRRLTEEAAAAPGGSDQA